MAGDKILIIGCGNMGGALGRGISRLEGQNPADLIFYDKDPEKAVIAAEAAGGSVLDSLPGAGDAGTVLLCVKPQDLEDVSGMMKAAVDAETLIVSIMAGVSISTLQDIFGPEVVVVRAMPNMGALVGRSVTAVSFARDKGSERRQHVLNIFSSVGGVIEVDEKLMHAVTAVSGSGPAYFFLMAEELRRAAVNSGLSDAQARYLSELTLDSAAGVLADSDMTAGELIDRVASKGGTTESALKVFRDKGFSSIVSDAVERARIRSEQLEGGN